MSRANQSTKERDGRVYNERLSTKYTLKEKELEDHLWANFAQLEMDGIPVSRQVNLSKDDNTSIDILALLRDGRLCIVELKRDTADEAAIVQLLKYASLLACPNMDLLNNVAIKHSGRPLAELYKHHFGQDLPTERLGDARLVLVASDFDAMCASIALHLTGVVKVDFHLRRFQPGWQGKKRTFTYEDFLPPNKTRNLGAPAITDKLNLAAPAPAGKHYLLSFDEGQYFTSDWQGLRGYLTVGNDPAERAAFEPLECGDYIHAFLTTAGYVGCAEVESPLRPWQNHDQSPMPASFVVPIRWLATRSREMALRGAEFPHPKTLLVEAPPHLAQRLSLAFRVSDLSKAEVTRLLKAQA